MNFDDSFHALTGFPPFLWQKRLFAQYFAKGETPAALDLPTGLGKTSVMAIWLIALTGQARAGAIRLPRRLVYVVDRRAVVDQATDEAEKLRKALEGAARELKAGLGLADTPLPISTLRGQHVDNREWLADPASPAIIVGTVDMIGSRLLFEGYGVSRKMRPYHAGLLGADALIVLDEAHLVPPFEKMLESIENGTKAGSIGNAATSLGPSGAVERKIIPAFKLLSLSATGRERTGAPFRLIDEDFEDEVVKKRLQAKKALTITALADGEKIDAALASAAWRLSGDGANDVRCLIYCDKRETAQRVFDDLSVRAKAAKKGEPEKAEVELFTGARRFFEREETIKKLKPFGFIAGQKNETGKPVFLVATSAAEVGVDLDANHMVCDLVAWERMAQRLGRVNRRGEGDAKIIVVIPQKPSPKNPNEPTESEKRDLTAYQSLAVIRSLREAGDSRDASPAGLLDLRRRATTDETLRVAINAATTPAPLRPALTRALVDAWSMTSLERHTGRPEVAPWLRGWVDEDGPRTAVVWRAHLPVRESGEPTKAEIEEFFEAAPPHVSEQLEMETYAVADWLTKRAAEILKTGNAGAHSSEASDDESEDSAMGGSDEKALADAPEHRLRPNDIVAFALSSAREFKKCYRLSEFDGDKKRKDALERELAGATLIVDARFRGLSDGLLDPKASGVVPTVDDGGEWLWEEQPEAGKPRVPLVKFRVRSDQSEDEDDNWHKPFKFALSFDGEDNAVRCLIVEKWRGASTKEDERSISPNPQSLSEHQSWAEARAIAIAKGVDLNGDHAKTLAIAARLHDEGKARELWQRAMGKPRPRLEAVDPNWPYAKTEGRGAELRLLQINGETFRHEFASISEAERNNALGELSGELRDLALHLIAAHHGFARPVIAAIDPDAPPSALQERAREVALRFARLQKQWGPWGLAWWEALLRAADAQASRDNDSRSAKTERA